MRKTSPEIVLLRQALEAADDAATQIWGGSWRMPTIDEWTELHEKCNWIWTDDYNDTGVADCIVASRTNGNSIFLPAAGFRGDDKLYDAGSVGDYWSSSLDGIPHYAQNVYFGSDSDSMYDYYRFVGRSVRPVYAK